jgi:hypothetical protein
VLLSLRGGSSGLEALVDPLVDATLGIGKSEVLAGFGREVWGCILGSRRSLDRAFINTNTKREVERHRAVRWDESHSVKRTRDVGVCTTAED